MRDMSQSGVSVREGRKESVCNVNRNMHTFLFNLTYQDNNRQTLSMPDRTQHFEDNWSIPDAHNKQ